jgi:hypothetical protein
MEELMKRLLRQAEAASPEAAEMLRIIDKFDDQTANRSSMEVLSKLATEECGRRLVLIDQWNGCTAMFEPDNSTGSDVDGEFIQQVLEAAVNARLRGRRSRIIDVDGTEVLAASLETASGRTGIVWFERGDRDWTLKDHVVAERLAIALVTDVLRAGSLQDSGLAIDNASVEQLLAGGLDASEAAVHTKKARLSLSAQLVCVAIGEIPSSATSAPTLARLVTRELANSRIAARSSIISGRPALIAEYSERLINCLDSMVSGIGTILCFGVGEPVQPEKVHLSWEQAKEALLLRSLATTDRRVSRFRDLGLLHLLALIPESEVTDFSDYVRIEALARQGSHPTDLELLEAYCETGSLRAAATAVFLHFTTVRARLNRIGIETKLDLNDPSDRLRAHVAVKLVQVHRARAMESSLSFTSTTESHKDQSVPDVIDIRETLLG